MTTKSTHNGLLVSVFLAILLAAGSSIISSTPAMGATIVYSQGFETTNGSYTHSGSNDQWQWGTPTSGPGSAHQGSKCWATNLVGNVPMGSNSYLTSPAIPIPALGPNEIARVRFFGWIQIDEMFDRGEFQVSSNNVDWQTIAEFFYLMQGEWTEYYFDVSNYAGGNLYLRFRLYADYQDAFWIEKGGPPPYSSVNMAGWYIDDIAVVVSETPATQVTLTLEAFENQYELASCPWIYTWDGETYVKDNDVYSTARGSDKEYTDYYALTKPLVATSGQYRLQLRETNDESSFTDLMKLIMIDHGPDVAVGVDDNGNIWTYRIPGQPVSALDDRGSDVLNPISAKDGIGIHAYDGDYVILDFSNLDTSYGATLVLSAQGFQQDSAGAGNPIPHTPGIQIQTMGGDGNWVTRNKFYPRMELSTSAYDLRPYLGNGPRMVRLFVTSCLEGKYHLIDYVGLDTSPQAPTTISVLSPIAAVHSATGDVLNSVESSDGTYAFMSPLESIDVAFDAPESAGGVRDFVVVSEGYYVPTGTFFIYTWDGTGWAQRDAWSQQGPSDATKYFDLSPWLPDPEGEYKVRIWQDYWYNDARIDFVGLVQGGLTGTLSEAVDLRNSACREVVGCVPFASAVVRSSISASDNTYMLYAQEPPQNYYTGPSGYIQRDRWLEVKWTGLTANRPPTTNPVMIANEASATPTIGWTYNDADGDPQVQYEVEVWTGSGGTGTNVWDPAVGAGTGTATVYGGSALIPGQTYYARVKAYDGTSWGGWSEAYWVFALVPCPDADNDGYALCDATCVLTAGIACGDCNDGDPAVNPGALEMCGNGIDDNCNSEIDEPGCVPWLVTLVSFAATAGDGQVTLRWETAAEVDNEGFNLYRRTGATAYQKVNTALIPAQGSSVTGAVYEYVDFGLVGGTTYEYLLEDVDSSGKTTLHGPVQVTLDATLPAIRLVAPATNAQVALRGRITFTWDAAGPGTETVLVSTDPGFPAGATLVLPARPGQRSLAVPAIRIVGLTGRLTSPRIVYWQVVQEPKIGAQLLKSAVGQFIAAPAEGGGKPGAKRGKN